MIARIARGPGDEAMYIGFSHSDSFRRCTAATVQTRRAVSRPLLAVLLLRARKAIETAGENTRERLASETAEEKRDAFSSMSSSRQSTACGLVHQRGPPQADVTPAPPPAATGG